MPPTGVGAAAAHQSETLIINVRPQSVDRHFNLLSGKSNSFWVWLQEIFLCSNAPWFEIEENLSFGCVWEHLASYRASRIKIQVAHNLDITFLESSLYLQLNVIYFCCNLSFRNVSRLQEKRTFVIEEEVPAERAQSSRAPQNFQAISRHLRMGQTRHLEDAHHHHRQSSKAHGDQNQLGAV